MSELAKKIDRFLHEWQAAVPNWIVTHKGVLDKVSDEHDDTTWKNQAEIHVIWFQRKPAGSVAERMSAVWNPTICVMFEFYRNFLHIKMVQGPFDEGEDEDDRIFRTPNSIITYMQGIERNIERGIPNTPNNRRKIRMLIKT